MRRAVLDFILKAKNKIKILNLPGNKPDLWKNLWIMLKNRAFETKQQANKNNSKQNNERSWSEKKVYRVH